MTKNTVRVYDVRCPLCGEPPHRRCQTKPPSGHAPLIMDRPHKARWGEARKQNRERLNKAGQQKLNMP